MIPANKEQLSKEIVDAWFQKWEQLSEKIFASHNKRDGSATSLMEQGIEHFCTFIANNSIPSEDFQFSNEYELMPINGMERLQFVKARPGQYASYRQLDELFKETKKRSARLRAMKK